MCNPMPYYAGKLCAQVVVFFFNNVYITFSSLFYIMHQVYLFIYFLIKTGNFLCDIMF